MPTDRLSFLIFGHFLLPFVGDFPTRVGTDSRAFLCRFPTRRGPVEWCERSDNYVSDVCIDAAMHVGWLVSEFTGRT